VEPSLPVDSIARRYGKPLRSPFVLRSSAPPSGRISPAAWFCSSRGSLCHSGAVDVLRQARSLQDFDDYEQSANDLLPNTG